MSERRFFLRNATAAAHRELDGALGKINSRKDYAVYLHALTSFRSGIEDALASTTLPADGFAHTALSASLQSDCADLQLKLLAPVRSDIELHPDARFGITYVLEGSALGAPLLFQSASRLGFDGQFGARHLVRQMQARGNWMKFASLLESEANLDMDRVSQAAIATFNLALKAAQEAGNGRQG